MGKAIVDSPQQQDEERKELSVTREEETETELNNEICSIDQ